MAITIIKRDGSEAPFQQEKITWAIFKAATAVGGDDFTVARALSDEVVDLVLCREGSSEPSASQHQPTERFENRSLQELSAISASVTVEEIQDLVEKVLIEAGHAKTAKAYILYREKRRAARESNALVGATINMFSDYLDDKDWQIQENANTQKSINGMNNYVRETFTKQYWLHEVYPQDVRDAHTSGELHIHDLGFFGPYCAGWDLKQLLTDGFGGVPGKVESGPAKHLRSFLGQIVNSTFTTQGETAGAQAWSSFDTYCAPFIRADHLTKHQIKQALQEFIFNINVPTRVGFQCPFSNLTFDIVVPRTLKDEPAIVGGQLQDTSYGDYQEEMDLFNLCFCEVMLEGDSKGRVFTFPIPTINVTNSFDWNSPVVNAFFAIACKYGIPYFSNYINSDLSPEDALSMCCRLRLDTKELRKRGGGLFGSNPMTGSVGVVTINLPRIAYISKSKEEFHARLWRLVQTAKTSLEIKRKIIEDQTARGLYPFSAHFLRDVHARTGQYWFNHFNTIGIIGMNEACRNFFAGGSDLTTPAGQDFALDTMNYLRGLITQIQEETGHFYNLEATPAEGTSYRLAQLDRAAYPDIICAGDNVGESVHTSHIHLSAGETGTSRSDIPDSPGVSSGESLDSSKASPATSSNAYYTNSTQLPVGFTDDIFETLDLQDELQSLYTGGTVLHLYLGEAIPDIEVAKKLIRTAFENYSLPYVSLTPTFSICNDHGYINGEELNCPTCGVETEVWSRVVGYLRPVKNFHKGKKAEYADRTKYRVKAEQLTK
jgi:ribonucleoside-triphosphate reductase